MFVACLRVFLSVNRGTFFIGRDLDLVIELPPNTIMRIGLSENVHLCGFFSFRVLPEILHL